MLTPDLNTIQITDRGARIRWTSRERRPANDGDVFMGEIIGRRGQPLVGFVAAVRWDTGAWGQVKHIGAGCVRVVG